MPKDTFYNLPEEKKRIVLEAALKEFSQKNVHEASVANIVRDSEIARGSFYKYFENIEDLYYFLYHEITKKAHISVIDCIKKANGDLFKGLDTYLDELIDEFSEEKYHEYFKVVTLNLNYLIQQKMTLYSADHKEMATSLSSFTDIISTDNLKVETNQDLLDFFKVLVPTMHECLNDFFVNNWSREKLFKEYNQRIKWLKYGIIKQSEDNNEKFS